MNALLQFADLNWQKVFGIAIGACVFYYFLLFDDGSMITAQINAANTELTSEQNLLTKTEEKMKDLEAFREELNSQEAQVREVLSYLPKQINTSELLAMIQERATQSGMRVQKTEIDDKATRVEFYESLKMRVEMTGTFVQVTSFLSLLSKLPRLVTVDEISLVMAEPSNVNSTKLKFNATLVGYRYVEEEAAKLNPGGVSAPGQ